ncbi:fibronectin-binding protein A N-terminus-domain-containing protein [Paraphysoderma sedebokerense]|nr:fibronectin-binding protein A N-terminus-domain-containing protein [Paraphysoderma sedebokerense]
MKQRFSALDICAISADLQRLVGLRLQNVYDVNQKTYLFKFAKPDTKEFVLIESGIRIHSTQYEREKSTHPSPFAMKLRKHLRTRRLTKVTQLGIDRIIDFEFAAGEVAYHIIAEFYASGNIILTDGDYNILSLLRVVKPDESTKFAVGEKYNVESARKFEPITKERLVLSLNQADPKDTLKKLLNSKFDFGPHLTEHCILRAGLNPNLKVSSQFDKQEDSPQCQSLFQALQEGDAILNNLRQTSHKGYLIMKEHSQQLLSSPSPIEPEAQPLITYDDVHPFLFQQFSEAKYKEFETFDKAADEFFSEIESQKLDLKSRQQEEAAIKKLEAIRKEQKGRVQGLQSAQVSNVEKAQLIEQNLELVDQAILIIRSAVANAIDWKDLEEMVREEKKKGNPVAQAIASLKLGINHIVLSLRNPYLDEDFGFSDEDDENDEVQATGTKGNKEISVDIDIGISAHANARRYYEIKKASAVKEAKTLAASEKALKSAEQKIKQDLKQTRITATINKMRKSLWFEKFIWFISTENYLVLAGHDAQQNELLVKRYLRKGDLYIHADLHGAPTVIIKNPNPETPVPPSTLAQAGSLAVCSSRAWESKIVTSAWWVYDDQVSKTAPTGEYLTTGSFMIRGKKNFLPPSQLVYGFGILFKVDETSVGRHIGERRILYEYEEEDMRKTGGDDDDTEDVDADEETEDVELADNNDGSGNDSEVEDSIPQSQSATEPEPEVSSNPSLLKTLESLRLNDTSPSGLSATVDEESQSESDSDSGFPDTQTLVFPDTQISVGSVNSANISSNSGMIYGSAAPKISDNAEDKYGLEELNKTDDEEDGDDGETIATENSSADRKKRLTAKQRREQRKLRQAGSTPGSTTTENASAVTPKAESSPSKKNVTNQKAKQGQTDQPQVKSNVRGKKGKLKKLKDKYADQDEEDRRLALEVLGSSKGPQPKGKKAKKQAAAALEKEKQQAKYKGTKDGKSHRKGESPAKPLREEGVGIAAQNEVPDEEKTVPLDDADSEEVKKLLEEENVALVDEDEQSTNPFNLDSLTGQPDPNDIILYAIPVAAPYSSLQKYKYKVKLTPGSMKKGKASKLAMSVFLGIADVEREKECLKSIGDAELIGTMLGKVKVSAASLESVKGKAKGKKGRGRGKK